MICSIVFAAQSHRERNAELVGKGSCIQELNSMDYKLITTPIKRNANGFVKGNCLWNEFISGNNRILLTEVDEYDIEKDVHWFDIAKAAN